MPRYNVNSPVKHGGRFIKTGVVSMEAEQAEELLLSGALSPAEAEQEPNQTPANITDGEDSGKNGAAPGEPDPQAGSGDSADDSASDPEKATSDAGETPAAGEENQDGSNEPASDAGQTPGSGATAAPAAKSTAKKPASKSTAKTAKAKS